MTLAVTAALVALACTPLAFAVLGRMEWFKARRGRTMQRPDVRVDRRRDDAGHGHPGDLRRRWWSRASQFDKDRYEFDPNKTWSVLEQGRGFHDVEGGRRGGQARDGAAGRWSGRTWSTTSRSSTRRCWRCGPSRGRRPPWRRRSRTCSQRLAEVRRSVGVDGPQQLMDFTAPPVDLAAAAAATPAPAAAGNVAAPAIAAPLPRPGRQRADRRPRSTPSSPTVPEPQRADRRDAPADRPPAGLDRRQVGRAAPRDVQRRQPVREDRRPRRELHRVRRARGWPTPTSTRPATSRTRCRSTSSRWATRSRRWASTARRSPRRSSRCRSGRRGTPSAGSTLFYSGPYYTQIVSTSDDRQVRRLRPRAGPADRREAGPKPERRSRRSRPR